MSFKAKDMSLPRPDPRSSVTRQSVFISEIDQIRSWQERRLEIASESWDKSKKLVEDAIARVEAQEREYKAVSSDVSRKLEALELVISMGKEVDQTSSSQNGDNSPEHPSPVVRSSSMLSGFVRKSRPLFSFGVRSTRSPVLSILSPTAEGS